MKAVFSEEYYRKNWNRFLQRVPGENFIDLEKELSASMRTYEEINFPGEALSVIQRVEAKKIADKCFALVQKEKKTIIEIEAGRASLGYTTQRQEIEARAELRKRFEFNCLQLRDFKAKYAI